MSAQSLPGGRHVVVTQSITTSMTGMTHALLYRTRALIETYDVDVEILLLDQRRSLPQLIEWLESRGLAHPRMRFVSLWDDVAAGVDLSPAMGPRIWRLKLILTDLRRRLGTLRRSRKAGLRALLRTSLTTISSAGRSLGRADLQKIGRRRLAQPGLLELSTAAGRRIGITRGWWALWSTWLRDRLDGDEPVNLLCDNWHVVDLLTQWGLPNVATTYVVHSDHIGSKAGDLHGEGWTQGRGFALQRVDQLDACVFLTEQQRDQFVTDHGDPGNLHVVPNSISAPVVDVSARDERRGIAMTRLVAIKRPAHAVAAIQAVSAAGVEFDIFGGTPHKDQWDALIEQIGDDERIRLRGRTDDPIAEFARASFMLVTSTSEGFGLSIVEAMSVGCVPICYDIRYGPGEIVTHGVDGYVVPAVPERLAEAIDEFLALPPQRVEQMRQAARRRAEDFADEAVVRRWPEVLAAAAQRRSTRESISVQPADLYEIELAAKQWHAS